MLYNVIRMRWESDKMPFLRCIMQLPNYTVNRISQGCGVLVFCGTPTPTPGLKNLGLQTPTPALKTWTPTPSPKSDSDSNSRT